MATRGWAVGTVGLFFALFAFAHGPRHARAAVGAFSLTAPANGAFVGATPTLTWGASTGATSYTLTLTPASGVPLVKTGLTTTSYAIATSEALTEAGSPYSWRVTARDDGANTIDSSTASFFVDVTPPGDFGLTAPAAGVFSRAIDARFTWEGAVDSGSGISKYHFYVDGVLCGDATGAGFAFLPSTCNPTDGSHTWAVSAQDVAGNIKWCKESPGGVGGRLIKIDNTGPSAESGGVFQLGSANVPEQLGTTTDRMVDTGINVVTGDVITVTSTGMWCFLSCTSGCYDTTGFNNPVNTPTQSCNNTSLIARIGGGTQFKCIGKMATFTAGLNDTGILELGSNTNLGCADKTVTATVMGGRTFTLGSPAADAVVNQQFPTFSWEAATDQGSGGVTYQLSIDGVVTGSTAQSSGTVITDTSYTIPVRLPDGVHTWKVRARDAAGNGTDSTTRKFTVDTTRPEQFRLRIPGAGSCAMTPTPNLCWNSATDADAVDHYQLWIDGALALTTPNNFTLCGTPSVALSQGTHSWYAVAIDRAGNARQSLETFSLLIDYTPPSAPTLTAPTSGASTADPPGFAWNAATDAGGISKYEVYVDSALATTVSAATLSWLLPSDPTSGPHTWYVRAIDACNQGTASATASFTTTACVPDTTIHPCPGYNQGRCIAGTRTCVAAGTWSACAGTLNPIAETCNSEDDDCDGLVDNGTNGCGGVCTLPVNVYTPCDGPDADMCQEGVYMCTGLNTLNCVETTPVDVESCNGRDDDCNGIVDDGTTCTAPPPSDGGVPPDGGGGASNPGSGGAGAPDAGTASDASPPTDGAGGVTGAGGDGGLSGAAGQGAQPPGGGQTGTNDAGQAGGGTSPTDGGAIDAVATSGGGATDAGTIGTAGAAGHGGGTPSGMGGGAPKTASSNGGCACGLADDGDSRGPQALFSVVAVALALRRRRRRDS